MVSQHACHHERRRNPGMNVGDWQRTMNITNGAVVQLNGNGAASVSSTNDTFVNIGGGQA